MTLYLERRTLDRADIETLELSRRATHCLVEACRHYGIITLDDLGKRMTRASDEVGALTDAELLRIPRLGHDTLKEIRQALSEPEDFTLAKELKAIDRDARWMAHALRCEGIKTLDAFKAWLRQTPPDEAGRRLHEFGYVKPLTRARLIDWAFPEEIVRRAQERVDRATAELAKAESLLADARAKIEAIQAPPDR